MNLDWPTSTLNAIRRLCGKRQSPLFSRRDLIKEELNRIVVETGSEGATPEQTLSRILQDLRDADKVEFLGGGEYRLKQWLSERALPNGQPPKNIPPRNEIAPPLEQPAISNLSLRAVDLAEPVFPDRSEVTVNRIIRDTLIVRELKKLYDYRCQFCNTTIVLLNGLGRYCEAHHIRPLGRPHAGSDSKDNIIVVCPNHHAMLDYGVIPIEIEKLILNLHALDPHNVSYHNETVVGARML
jgi:hypothetical protein